ncbi:MULTISPECIES: hypothetical protein [Leptospira]|uniref:hypothetical protein n=1 Tax=Leptospira TaxID=171 RepID=UPI0004AC489B|nr:MULTISPECIES: hypothetical protein [Leptospira]UMQ56580.1 hypothetical protein FH585_01300 [Leptospira interrogans]UNE65142.1 hypothetical protein FH588_00425 [Leptospira interrogans]
MFFRVKLFSSNKVLQKRYAVVTLKKIVFFLQGYLKKISIILLVLRKLSICNCCDKVSVNAFSV